jgi:hypothetical protein
MPRCMAVGVKREGVDVMGRGRIPDVRRRAEPAAPVEQSAARHNTVRVISVYATRWRHQGHAEGRQPDFDLGRLWEFFDLFRDQVPRVIAYEPIAPDELVLEEARGEVEITMAESWLFALPFAEVVAALTLDFLSPDLNVDETPAVKVLEHCAYAKTWVRGQDLASHVAALAERAGATARDERLTPMPPERHQIVFAREAPDHKPPDEDKLKRILYRIDPPYRDEFMPIERPAGLNQEGRTLGAVTPYVSLLYGHQEYVQNSIFLTTVQTVGAAARFRQIWYEAYQHVRKFRETGQAQEVGVQRREDLEELVDELGNLELDLSGPGR